SAVTSTEAVISDSSDNADLLDFCFLCSRQFFHERVEDYGTERIKDEEVLETFFEELGPVDRSLLQCCPACKALCKTLIRTKAALSSLIDEITKLLLRSRKVSYLLSKSRVVSRLFQSSNSSLPPCETSTSYLQQPLSQINFHKDVSSTANNSTCFPTQFDLQFDSSNKTVGDSLDLGLSQPKPSVIKKSPPRKPDKRTLASKMLPINSNSEFSLILNESIMNSVSDNACDVSENEKALQNANKQINISSQFESAQQPFISPISKNKPGQSEHKHCNFLQKSSKKLSSNLQMTTFKEISNNDAGKLASPQRKPEKERTAEVLVNQPIQLLEMDKVAEDIKSKHKAVPSPKYKNEESFVSNAPSKNETEEPSKPTKVHKCDICDKSFQTGRNLRNHLSAHSQERKYICEVCGVSYRHKVGLEAHVAIHNGEPKFQCEICNKIFTQKSGLQRHSALHTGKHQFQCDLCGKQFLHHSSFSSHKLIHEGTKNFACAYCDLNFKTKWHLERHTRVHTGEKSFQCGLCEKSFAAKYNLTQHLKSHENTASRHQCPKCPKTFTRKFKMNLHFNQIHA
ncbi:putative zinc finger protein, partial [Orchesella cincta]